MQSLRKRFPIYSSLLRLYPANYYSRYAEEILATTAAMLDAAPARKRSSIWFHILLEFPGNIVNQQYQYTATALTHETPRYARRSSLVSTTLLAPFIAIVFTNDAMQHSLHHSWLWSAPVFTTWVLVLPILSFVVSIVTLGAWLYEHKTAGQSVHQSLQDIRHHWALSAVSLLSLVILAIVIVRVYAT